MRNFPHISARDHSNYGLHIPFEAIHSKAHIGFDNAPSMHHTSILIYGAVFYKMTTTLSWDLPGDVLAAPASALCGWKGVISLNRPQLATNKNSAYVNARFKSLMDLGTGCYRRAEGHPLQVSYWCLNHWWPAKPTVHASSNGLQVAG